MKDLKRVEVRSRSELRSWLERNFSQTDSIWLVTYKKAVGEWHVDYASIVEEALCFGWIDSLPRRLDEKRTMLRLSPRKPGSAWSKLNRDRVAKLIKRGEMRPPGLAAVARAKKDGSWSKLKASDSGAIPSDLRQAFARHPGSKALFAAFPPSSKRSILEWILSAKAPETRAKRVEETARLAAQNVRANHYRQPKGAKRGA